MMYSVGCPPAPVTEMTSPRPRAAASFTSGPPLSRPSLKMGSTGAMPYDMGEIGEMQHEYNHLNFLTFISPNYEFNLPLDALTRDHLAYGH